MRHSHYFLALKRCPFKAPHTDGIARKGISRRHFLCGVTLLELLVVISISGILASTAAPNLMQWLKKNAADDIAVTLAGQLQYAREQAINRNQMISLCGANKDGNCVSHDIEFIQIFIDSNKNKILDEHEQLLLHTSLNHQGDLRLNAHTSITFKTNGTSHTPASFIYCPETHDTQLIRRITLSFTGRPYIAQMSKNSAANSPSCPNWGK